MNVTLVDIEALYEAHADRLRRVVTRRVRDAHLAEDIVQETFLRAHRFIDRLDHERSPWPWLRTIAMRLAFNATRSQRFDKEDLVAEPIELPDVDGAAVHGERRLLQAGIARVLASLPHRQQRLLVLHDMYGVGCDELALTEGATATALRQATSRARRALRDDANVARLGALAPVAACVRAIRRAFTSGEALAPMAVMVCALVPSMMLLPAHPATGTPRPSVAGAGVHVASTASQAFATSPTDDADALVSARPASVPVSNDVPVPVVGKDDMVGPEVTSAEEPIFAELETGERRTDGEAGVEQDAPNASTPSSPSSTSSPTAPPSYTFTGPTGPPDSGPGNVVVGGEDPDDLTDGSGNGLKTTPVAPTVVNPTYGGTLESTVTVGQMEPRPVTTNVQTGPAGSVLSV